MQVLLHTDPHVDGRHPMADHVQTVVQSALAHFPGRVTRVEAYLADENSPVKASPDVILCTLEARLTGMEPVVVKDHAGTAHQAIQGAAAKLKRAIGTALAKHDPRHATAMPLSETEPEDPAADR